MIKRRWQLQSEADKEEVKRSLLELLRARHDRVKPYVLNKLVQVIAVGARC